MHVSSRPGFTLHELTLQRLRALVARAQGDQDTGDDLMARLRVRALELGFEALAERVD